MAYYRSLLLGVLSLYTHSSRDCKCTLPLSKYSWKKFATKRPFACICCAAAVCQQATFSCTRTYVHVPVLSQYSVNVEPCGCTLFRHFEKLMMAGSVSNTVTDTIVISSGSDSSEVTPVKNFPASQSEEFRFV